MREIKDHIVEGDLPQNQLKIEVTDEPGSGGANHRYEITGFHGEGNPSGAPGFPGPFERLIILFQNGPIQESGVNGITQEALLAIVIDRLRSFQAGPFPCEENAECLSYCEMALDILKERTRMRLARGVEGKSVP